MRKLILFFLFMAGLLAGTQAFGQDAGNKKKDKNMDYQFVTADTRRTDIDGTFLGCTFGLSEAEVLATLEKTPDIRLDEKAYGRISTGPVFYEDILFQTAQLLFTRNRFSHILYGSSFRNYDDALNVYLRVKQYLAQEYGPSLFRQKKENMANAYDLGGQNACLLSLSKKEDKTNGNVNFHLIVNFWNKNLQAEQ